MLRSLLASIACLLTLSSFAPAAEELKFSGPFTEGNLTLYLIHGPSAVKEKYLTLEEALAQKKAIVHETGDVNELSIENTSDEKIYVQSGDIVKGGKQDRTLGTDFTLAPKSGKVKIASFCVEHGRWTQRGTETVAMFDSSSGLVAGKRMKLAGNSNYRGGQQQKVWDEVAANQQKLSKNLGTDIASGAASPSSFQLTLENKDVQAATDKYIAKLKDAPAGKDDVIGYVIAINGQINCADVYGSSELFTKLWPKLLRSAAVEAAAEVNKDAKFEPPSMEQVRVALKEAERGEKKEKKVARVNITTIETPKAVMFECTDADSDSYLHRSVITKD